MPESGEPLSPDTAFLKRNWKTFAVLLGVAVLGYWTAARYDGGRLGQPPSPSDFVLPDLEGKPVRLSDYRGKIVLLDFWATWCVPCMEEVPELKAVYGKYKDRNFTVIGVSVDEGGRGPVEAFVKEFNVPYPILTTGGLDNIPREFPVRGLPTAYLLDGSGVVREKYYGFKYRAQIEEDIEALMREGADKNPPPAPAAAEPAPSSQGPSPKGETGSRSLPPGKPNHLIGEKSPYLQQHARNPVNWHPWGPEAFREAREENKPIFLSIGYSACHWCHVMERESFSDPEIARILNEHFVSVKVDREELPAVDKIYMGAVQAMTGSVGWPLSVWLTPELEPFFGGTYFPSRPESGRPSFREVLEKVRDSWRTERPQILASAGRLSQRLKISVNSPRGARAAVPADAGEKLVRALAAGYDREWGGFGAAPKFPAPSVHAALLSAYARARDPRALKMSVETLRKMAGGGIYDQLGGGFHRYSTDRFWRVPHFEKMLYDNAQLAGAYLTAYQITRDEDLAQVARRTLDYVLRDMTSPEGGFYSAQDADSLPAGPPGAAGPDQERKEEGAFYVWRKSEIKEALGPAAAEVFCFRYGVSENGNAKSGPGVDLAGQNVLYAARSVAETAQRFHKTESEVQKILKDALRRLFERRALRSRPELDDKILAAWNGLMISAFARGSQILSDPEYLAAAQKAAEFIRTRMSQPQSKRLYRRWRQGESKVEGTAADYAFVVQGLLDLYEASFEPRWLRWAVELAEAQNHLFFDEQSGGYFMTAAGHDSGLLVRPKEDSDDAEPSASSVAALNLLRLAQFTDREDLRRQARKTFAFFAEQIKSQPRSLPQMISALDYSRAKAQQIIIAGDPAAADTQWMLRAVHERFIPHKILVLLDGGENQNGMAEFLPFVKNMRRLDGKATAYVCVNYACELPTNDLKTLRGILDGNPLKKLGG